MGRVGEYVHAHGHPAHPMSHRNLKPHRKRNAFTQKELGFLLGRKTHSTISRYEAGERSPNLETAFAYQLLFDRQLDELFPGLRASVRAELAERARTLAEEIRRTGEGRKAAYKLERLAELNKKGGENAPAI
jgi:transcriptional regulator with XRE-family HTH domain